MGSCAAPSAKGDDKFITTDYLQQCRSRCPDSGEPAPLTNVNDLPAMSIKPPARGLAVALSEPSTELSGAHRQPVIVISGYHLYVWRI
uniref:Transposase n=2 Tax=Klebsiella pneumoniae TaxID=573 RepID=A0A223LMD5_KLEPN|nr:transposase [Klebsiella pneumoniae]